MLFDTDSNSSRDLGAEFELPDTDDRAYRLLVLDNQLEALLIHDEGAEEAAAALDVAVGSLHDTDDMPGIAHAVEHILPMGTKKYPQSNAYDGYLSQYSGYSNALTELDSTKYHFTLSYPPRSVVERRTSPSEDDPLYGALDRFAQMFVDPLFSEESFQGAIESIESEFGMNFRDDAQRIVQVNKSLANPYHPCSRFAPGNRITLFEIPVSKGHSPREKCLAFFRATYAASRMKLVVLGREGLDILETWVREIFAAIPDRPVHEKNISCPVYTEEQLCRQVFIKPILWLRWMHVQFVYQDEEGLQKTHPSWYITYLLEHEGPGSISALLRAKGWANSIRAQPLALCQGSSLFRVDIELTKQGLQTYEEIVVVLFQYIAMMQHEGPQEWIVEKLMRSSQMNFRFRAKSPPGDTVVKLAGDLQAPHPGNTLLSGPATIQKYDVELVRGAISYLRPDNFTLTIVDPDNTGVFDKKEPYYGAEFRVEHIPPRFICAINNAFCRTSVSEELSLPVRDNFVLEEIDLCGNVDLSPSAALHPVLITCDERSRVWWKHDTRFSDAKAIVHVYIRTPYTDFDARKELLALLFWLSFEDSLSAPLQIANAAGQDFAISCDGDGIEIGLDGFTNGLSPLLQQILTKMKDFEVDEQRFHFFRDRLTESMQDSDLEPPYEQIGPYSDYFRSDTSSVFDNRAEQLSILTTIDLENFRASLFQQCQIEILAHGMVSQDEALGMSTLVRHAVPPTSLLESRIRPMSSVVLPAGSNFVYERRLRDKGVQNCIEYSVFAGHCYDTSVRARLHMLAQIIDEPCFHQLRTIEQLGYVVRSELVFLEAWAGFSILVQSKQSCVALEGRINAFLHGFEQILDRMDSERFKHHQQTLITQLRMTSINLNDVDKTLWRAIKNGICNFAQGT
jgi:insulysin